MSDGNEAIDLNSLKKLSTIVTDRLAEQILNGVLEPGERLVQMDLAKRYNVSRVAVRDALMELRRRGLSVNLPHRGDIVRPVSCKTVQDLFEVRRINEGHAVRLSVEKIDAAGIEKLKAILASQEECSLRGDADGTLAKDWDFHRTIFEYCGNESLKELIEALWARTRQARSVAKNDIAWGRKWGSESIRRHRELLTALERHDGEEAAKITERNIVEAAVELVEKLKVYDRTK